MSAVFDRLDHQAREKLEAVEQPEWVEPMLAKLTDDPFSDPGWIYERKVDGERCLAFRRGDAVRLLSRNQESLNIQYPELEKALLKTAPERFVLDGEVVAFEGDVTSFSQLQERMHVNSRAEAQDSGVSVYYYLFDILYLSDHKITKVPLRQRKRLLKHAFDFQDPLRFLSHRNETGKSYFEEACRKGWEGVIAKQADWPYVHSRSSKWLKFKCVSRQEFVIGGYTEPHGERIAFGALLIGYYEDEQLVYAGKVGTGYDDDTLRRLGERLGELEQEDPPFADGDLPGKDVHWVRPRLVAEIGFSEWTDYGKLRHPRYLGLRQDKEPQDVHREQPP
ncbi:MAG: non-homologous end-joining DNA ligase [Candidatus Promineifilaceae bacterium]|nr:non-homologous end-joining DNA ligase [Candidatus Promineifilaceae bacterium]